MAQFPKVTRGGGVMQTLRQKSPCLRQVLSKDVGGAAGTFRLAQPGKLHTPSRLCLIISLSKFTSARRNAHQQIVLSLSFLQTDRMDMRASHSQDFHFWNQMATSCRLDAPLTPCLGVL